MAEDKMVANFWLHGDASYTSNNIEAFLNDTFEKFQDKKVDLFRADSGFYDRIGLNYLEEKSINYLVAVRLYAPVQQQIASHKTWLQLSDGIEVAESIYQSPLWNTSKFDCEYALKTCFNSFVESGTHTPNPTPVEGFDLANTPYILRKGSTQTSRRKFSPDALETEFSKRTISSKL